MPDFRLTARVGTLPRCVDLLEWAGTLAEVRVAYVQHWGRPEVHTLQLLAQDGEFFPSPRVRWVSIQFPREWHTEAVRRRDVDRARTR